MDLERENANLRKQLAILADARNQEVLDLQHHFAERIRQLEAMKGLDKSAELEALNGKIVEMEGELLRRKEENTELRQKAEELEKKVKELERKLKETEKSKEDMHYWLEKAKADALKAAQVERARSDPAINIDELLMVFEEQMAALTEVVTQKQEEIKRLQKLVHKECEERVRLQKILGLTVKQP